MIKFIKTHKLVFGLIVLLLLVDSFVIAINFISSKKDVTAPGGLNEVRELIEVEGNNDIKGSFNTIYVYSYTYNEFVMFSSFSPLSFAFLILTLINNYPEILFPKIHSIVFPIACRMN